MIHPATELRFIDDQIGWGVFATAFIPAGTITWVRDAFDQTFTQAQVDKLPPQYRPIIEKYAYLDAAADHVLCWDHARFVNHSCEASCLGGGYDFEIAVRDLQPGDELTDDYGTLNLLEDFNCACTSDQCRKVIKPDDVLMRAPVWDAMVEPLFRKLRQIPQPLWPFLSQAQIDEVEKTLAEVLPYRSIRLLSCRGVM